MTELAVRLAKEGRWEDAVRINRAIIENFPNDIEAYNRLGKALLELRRYEEARDAYVKALELDPHNTIAQRNLSRLGLLASELAKEKVPQTPKLPPEMFIEEMGKTGVTTLIHPNRERAVQLSAGDEVVLRPKGRSLIVEGIDGSYLGEIEPRLAQRLVRLMEGGNRYVAAISQVTDAGDVKVFIREVFQHPSQIGKLSFLPEQKGELIRPYVRERLVRQDEVEPILDEEIWEELEGDEWEQARNRLAEAEAVDLEEEEEEDPTPELEEDVP